MMVSPNVVMGNGMEEAKEPIGPIALVLGEGAPYRDPLRHGLCNHRPDWVTRPAGRVSPRRADKSMCYTCAMKIIHGQRDRLERRLVEALLKGDDETFETINRRLKARATLSPCPDRTASDPAATSASDGILLEHAIRDTAARLKANDEADPLERNTLLAIIEDREEEANRLLEVMRKRNSRGLTVLKGEKATLPRSF